MSSRRNFLKQGSTLGLAGIVAPSLLSSTEASANMIANKNTIETPYPQQSKWADGSRMVITLSMQFEAGGQPENAGSPFPQDMKSGFKDYPAETWYQYGYKEGIPRLLDLWDKYNYKVTSFMVGSAVEKHPQLAKEIVQRGHEAAAHGMDWKPVYDLPYADEKKFILDGVNAIKKATGVTPTGHNANWFRRGENTLKILQELGFNYHIDDVSRDEPFIIKVNNKDFAVVPYTLRCNDIVLVEGKNFSSDQFLNQLKMEFDQLYSESATKRRMMPISFHDRIGGSPQIVQAAKEFFNYVAKHKGVSFKRKDEIAEMTLADKTSIRDEAQK